MRARDILSAVEAHLGHPVSWNTVYDSLSEHTLGAHPRYARIGRGIYTIRGESHE